MLKLKHHFCFKDHFLTVLVSYSNITNSQMIVAQNSIDFICLWFYETGIQVQLSLGSAWVINSTSFPWWLDWKVQEGFAHMAGAWVLLHVASIWPHANLSFLTTWWSSSSKTSYMTATFQGKTFQATKVEAADLLGPSLSSYTALLPLHLIGQNKLQDQARCRARINRPPPLHGGKGKKFEAIFNLHNRAAFPDLQFKSQIPIVSSCLLNFGFMTFITS